MARKQQKDETTGILIGVGIVAVAGALILHYLTSGVGDANATLVPDGLEVHVDRVVEALNQKFGKRWVNRALATLRAGLASTLPPQLVLLVNTVHRVEQLGQQYGWNGNQKRSHAVGLCQT
jgi:hypothetical protein